MMFFVVWFWLFFSTVSANAHHLGERIDAVISSREPAFELTDNFRMPRLLGTDVDLGHIVERCNAAASNRPFADDAEFQQFGW